MYSNDTEILSWSYWSQIYINVINNSLTPTLKHSLIINKYSLIINKIHSQAQLIKEKLKEDSQYSIETDHYWHEAETLSIRVKTLMDREVLTLKTKKPIWKVGAWLTLSQMTITGLSYSSPLSSPRNCSKRTNSCRPSIQHLVSHKTNEI